MLVDEERSSLPIRSGERLLQNGVLLRDSRRQELLAEFSEPALPRSAAFAADEIFHVVTCQNNRSFHAKAPVPVQRAHLPLSLAATAIES